MIVGQRTRLRLLEQNDLPIVARWRNQPRVFEQFFGRYPVALSEQATWYQRYLNTPNDRMWIIETLEGRAIGAVALYQIDPHHQKAELGRVMIGEEDSLHQGYATDAIRTLLAFAFREMNLNRVYLEVLSDNEAAIRLYECCGFQEEGMLRQAIWKGGGFRDVLVMGALRQEWMENSGKH